MATIPQLPLVLAEAPRDRMLYSFLMGIAYGVGGTAFNISIPLHRVLADLRDCGRAFEYSGNACAAAGARRVRSDPGPGRLGMGAGGRGGGRGGNRDLWRGGDISRSAISMPNPAAGESFRS